MLSKITKLFIKLWSNGNFSIFTL